MSQTRFTQTTRRFVFVLLAFAFLASSAFSSVAESGLPSTSPQSAVQPTVTLQAASRTTSAFTTQNGATVGGVLPEASDLPHLVLYRNGTLTPAEERTLVLELSGLEVSTAGVTVTLEIETQHRNPDFAGQAGPRLSVWQA